MPCTLQLVGSSTVSNNHQHPLCHHLHRQQVSLGMSCILETQKWSLHCIQGVADLCRKTNWSTTVHLPYWQQRQIPHQGMEANVEVSRYSPWNHLSWYTQTEWWFQMPNLVYIWLCLHPSNWYWCWPSSIPVCWSCQLHCLHQKTATPPTHSPTPHHTKYSSTRNLTSLNFVHLAAKPMSMTTHPSTSYHLKLMKASLLGMQTHKKWLWSVIRDQQAHNISLSHHHYIDEIVNRFGQTEAKDVCSPIEIGTRLTQAQCPSTPEEITLMHSKPYQAAVGSLNHAAVMTCPKWSKLFHSSLLILERTTGMQLSASFAISKPHITGS